MSVSDKTIWIGKPWQPYIFMRAGVLYYHLPVESGFISLSFEFPITEQDSVILQQHSKRYYYLFAALHDPFQLSQNNLSNEIVRHYMDVILHGHEDDVEIFITNLDSAPNACVRYLTKNFQEASF